MCSCHSWTQLYNNPSAAAEVWRLDHPDLGALVLKVQAMQRPDCLGMVRVCSEHELSWLSHVSVVVKSGWRTVGLVHNPKR